MYTKDIKISLLTMITALSCTVSYAATMVNRAAHSNTGPAKQEIKKFEKGGLGLEISGETSANFYAYKNQQRHQNGGKGRGTHLSVDDSRINFEVFGKALNTMGGLEYSFLIGMNGNTADGNNPMEENRLKFKGRWGTMMIGSFRGPTDFMSVGAFNTTGATGGVFGNYRGVINQTTGAIIKDDLAPLYTPKDQNKVAYITPRAYGFQIGYGFTPDANAKGEAKLQTIKGSGSGDIKYKAQNLHEFGINYKKKFENSVEFNTSFTTLLGKVKKGTDAVAANRNDIKAYAIGVLMKYAGFSVGGEFLNNNKSGELKSINGINSGKVYTLGIGYSHDVNSYSFSYMTSKRKLGKKNNVDFGTVKANNYALTYDREILPGLAGYVEGVRFDMKANQGIKGLKAYKNVDKRSNDDVVPSNKGHVMITGIRIKF